MQLAKTCTTVLRQLSDVVSQLEEQDFSKPSQALSHSTIGQHVRHTLEFFLCLEQGFNKGIVNYDKRAHDKLIETDKFIALDAIRQVIDFVRSQKDDRPLSLEVGYNPDNEACVAVETNYFRELIYNIEHAVHHMAIIKIGVREVATYVTLPPDFGIAISTIRHQESEAAER